MTEKNNLLTIDEARKLSETGSCQINRIAKEIEYAAKENRCCLYWSVYDTDRIALRKIIDTISLAGYYVERKYEDDDDSKMLVGLKIHW